MNLFVEVTLSLLKGFGTTCSVFGLTLVLALPLGLLISFGTMSKFLPLKAVFKTIVWVIRGVPLMLQLFVVYYVPGFVFGVPIASRLVATVIAFVINDMTKVNSLKKNLNLMLRSGLIIPERLWSMSLLGNIIGLLMSTIQNTG